MRKEMIIIVFMLFASELFAQIGVTGGLNLTKFDQYPEPLGTVSRKAENIGLVYEKMFYDDFIGMRTGILFSQKGNRTHFFPIAVLSNYDEIDEIEILDYIEIPVVGKVEYKNVYLLLGGYAGYAVKGERLSLTKSKGSVVYSYQIDTLEKEARKRLDFGAKTGLGLQYDVAHVRLFLESRFEIGLTEIYTNTTDKSATNFNISISGGILIGGGR